MMLSSSDRKLIELIAHVWVSQGGDEEGFVWNVGNIREAIRQETEGSHDKE